MINYYLLTKPGIVLGNLLTVAAGFLLASGEELLLPTFFATLAGLAMVIASACVLNNYIDRFADKKMERTKNRIFPKGVLSTRKALFFALFLGVAGSLILIIFTNLLTASVALVGFFIYVVLYSFLKYYTVYATAIGSIAGAIPPVVGYCAASNRFDSGALLLFVMMLFWQMPHFFAIAILHYEDYARAAIPLLPIKRGVFRTKVHMAMYTFAFCITTVLLALLGYVGAVYLSLSASVALIWFIFSLKGFTCADDRVWARQMFRLSLVMIGTVCLFIPFDMRWF